MISFRKADLLDHIDKMDKDAQPCRLDIDMVYDRSNQRAYKNGDKYVAKLKLHLGNPALFESMNTRVELAIGHRLGDNVYSYPNENFADFGNRITDEFKQKLYPICTIYPTSHVFSDPPSSCRIEIECKVIKE